VPVRADPVSVPAPVVSEQAAAGAIEIVLPDGPRLRVGNDIGLAALRRVLTVLRG
jgi:transposase